MTEDEVNLRVKEWLQNHSFTYKGILNKGVGQVPVPDGNRHVLLDHQGFNDYTKELVWIEAKGSGAGFSQLLEGFIRTCYAIYHGGGNGYLAIPHSEFQKMIEQSDFLKDVSVSINGKGVMGILDVEESQLVLF